MTFLAFFKVVLQSKRISIPATMNAKQATIVKIMWGIKLPSDTVEVTTLLLYLGVKTKTMINTTGTIAPKIPKSSGLLEERQARHHTMLKAMAMMIMKVPIPMPRIRFWGAVVWQFEKQVSNKIRKILLELINLYLSSIALQPKYLNLISNLWIEC